MLSEWRVHSSIHSFIHSFIHSLIRAGGAIEEQETYTTKETLETIYKIYVFGRNIGYCPKYLISKPIKT